MSDLAQVTKAIETGIARKLTELNFTDEHMVELLVEIAKESETDSTRVAACRLLHTLKRDAGLKVKRTITEVDGDTETVTEASGVLDNLNNPEIQQYKET